jgi:hypothetical protein
VTVLHDLRLPSTRSAVTLSCTLTNDKAVMQLICETRQGGLKIDKRRWECLDGAPHKVAFTQVGMQLAWLQMARANLVCSCWGAQCRAEFMDRQVAKWGSICIVIVVVFTFEYIA